jgi:ParB/RepB/Spo0J family partition protein
MAKNTPEGAKRSEMWKVDPATLKIDKTMRGRHFAPTKDKVKELAYSIYHEGQLQPSEVRKVAGGEWQLTSGYTRAEAVQLIRDGFSLHGEEISDPGFLLSVCITQCTDEDAFLHAIAENTVRNATTPVDDAFNQEILRTRYGMSNKDIAKRYGCDAAAVSRNAKLLTLPAATLRKLHEGQLSYSVAQVLADVPAEHHDNLTAPTPDGKPVSKQVVVDRIDAINKGTADTQQQAGPINGKLDAAAPQDDTQDDGAEGNGNGKAGKPIKLPKGMRNSAQMREMLKDYITKETNPVTMVSAKLFLGYLMNQYSKQDVEEGIRKIEGVIPDDDNWKQLEERASQAE